MMDSRFARARFTGNMCVRFTIRNQKVVFPPRQLFVPQVRSGQVGSGHQICYRQRENVDLESRIRTFLILLQPSCSPNLIQNMMIRIGYEE